MKKDEAGIGKQRGRPDSVIHQLCPACALCCDGTIFRDVELQAGDDATRLRALGLPLAKWRNAIRFPQPCAALDRYACRVYEHRPSRCRQFDCALLTAVRSGSLSLEGALHHVRLARRLADRVRRLLRRLGDEDDTHALHLRIGRTTRRLECAEPAPATATAFSQLTVAWHRLGVRLAGFFHPGTELPALKWCAGPATRRLPSGSERKLASAIGPVSPA